MSQCSSNGAVPTYRSRWLLDNLCDSRLSEKEALKKTLTLLISMSKSNAISLPMRSLESFSAIKWRGLESRLKGLEADSV